MEGSRAMKQKQGLCLLEVSWIGGLFIDFMSFEVEGIYHSMFCMFLSKEDAYLEVFGFVIVDTTDDEID